MLQHRVLFVGTGSIGLRHIESCYRVRPGIQVAAWRQGSSSDLPFPHRRKILQFRDLKDVLAFQAQLIWICNPTYLHASALERLAQTDAAIFLEKPLAHRSVDIQRICEVVEGSKKKFFYGCILRFHPLLEAARELMKRQKLGKPLSYALYCGNYLPEWRPNRDYKQTYSVRADQGGGVALDLIHEFDYAEFLFGPIEKIQGFKTHVSALEMDADDLCLALTRHANGLRGQIQLNCFRLKTRRDFEIVCTEGTIYGDFSQGKMEVLSKKASGELSTQTQDLSISREDLHDRQSESIFRTLESDGDSPWKIVDVARLTEKVLEIPFE